MTSASSNLPPSVRELSEDRILSGPRSVTRMLLLLETLSTSAEGKSPNELSTLLNTPESSLRNLLRPLVATAYLTHERGLYRLGPSAYRLSANITSAWNRRSLVRPFLEELARRVNESVFVGVLDEIGAVVTCVDAIESPHNMRFSVRIGGVGPLYATAAGRVLLAFTDSKFQDRYLETTNLERHTKHTLATPKRLREELARVHNTKLSVNLGGMSAEAATIAAPIFGAQGKVIAALGIGAPTERLVERLEELRSIIADVASRASGVGLIERLLVNPD